VTGAAPSTARKIVETPRLRLRELVAADAPFVLELLTDADFVRHIGDRGVRDLETAKTYIADGPQASYAAHGHGLWLAELRETGEPAGMCGLLRRDHLPDADLGYAWLPRFRGRGYALEAAVAVLQYAFALLRLPRVMAIVGQDNVASQRLLARVGMTDLGLRDIGGERLRVYAIERPVV
jgi:ribosomal-protein-alanine N-acetyltransferase